VSLSETSSRQNVSGRAHSQIVDFSALFAQFVPQSANDVRFAFHGHFLVLEQEFLEDVTIVTVLGKNFHEAGEHFFLNAVLGIHERSELFRKVDRLIDSHLGSNLFIFFEEVG